MKKSKRKSSIPGRSWEWTDGESTSGVHTFEGKFLCWTRPSGAGGSFGEMAREQSFDDFLEFGSPVFVPEPVAEELSALLGASR